MNEDSDESPFWQAGGNIFCGVLVFFMQVGFITMERGFVRSKNVKNILLKNTVDSLLCGLCWWAVGYGFAHGKSIAGFIGYTGFFYEPGDTDQMSWFFSWTYALCSVSIVSGCLAERTDLFAYPVYTVVMTGIVHPVVAHWSWTKTSWLHNISPCYFLDFAGGTVVHVSGGLMGLVGAIFVGPRIGRFEEGKAKPILGHDMGAVSLGAFFLWFGWYGFNCGSVFTYDVPNVFMLDRIALNMSLTACTSGLTTLLLVAWRRGTYDLCMCCNGILSGLVTSSAIAGFVAPWASAVSGIISGATYFGSSWFILHLKIDDPLDSSSIHCVCGAVGTLLNGVFAKPQYVEELLTQSCGGFVYAGNNGGLQLGMQLLGLVAIAAWVAFFSTITFYLLRKVGWLRIDQTTELAGIDNIEHGGPAYPEFNTSTPSHTS